MKMWQQILIGLFAGVAVGHFLPKDAADPTALSGDDFKFFGTIFINLIKMIIIPLIFFALINGITSIGASGNLRKMGLKSFSIYLSTAAFAVAIGLFFGTVLKPGEGLNLRSETAVATHEAAQENTPSVEKILLDMVPHNAIASMAEGHYLQVLVFALFVGFVLNMIREKVPTLITVCQQSATLCFKMIEIIIKLAPLGVFGFMASTISTEGLGVLLKLLSLVEATLIACFTQYLLFGVMLLVFGRLNPLPFYRKLLPTQLMAFSTSSSKATLPYAMRSINERMGVSNGSVNFVMPIGASINMDGTAIYLGICALFFAQAYGITLGWHDYFMLMFTATLGSIGAAGIPSGSIIFMGMVLNSVGLPLEGIALILGVDRLLDMVRTTVNITGDAAVTVLVDKTEGTLDLAHYHDKTK
ncbi:MAG: dicarboxylate/amino acid:cation symporter [Holosporales bacterium]|jgi:Na+/H+-dicarboxylate symporter